MKKSTKLLFVIVPVFAWLAIECGPIHQHHHPDGGPGGCSPAACLNGKHPCSTAACMVPPGGTTEKCEYGPKLTGACRCHVGDKRPCTLASGTGWTTCISASSSETRWDTCI